MNTQHEALITVLAAIIETDVGSRKVARCADAAIAVCESFPRVATLLNGGSVIVSGRSSPAYDFKAAIKLPDGCMIVHGGVDMATPGQQGELPLPVAAPELKFPDTAPHGISGIFKKIFS